MVRNVLKNEAVAIKSTFVTTPFVQVFNYLVTFDPTTMIATPFACRANAARYTVISSCCPPRAAHECQMEET